MSSERCSKVEVPLLHFRFIVRPFPIAMSTSFPQGLFWREEERPWERGCRYVCGVGSFREAKTCPICGSIQRSNTRGSLGEYEMFTYFYIFLECLHQTMYKQEAAAFHKAIMWPESGSLTRTFFTLPSTQAFSIWREMS